MNRGRTGQIIPITSALRAWRGDGHALDFAAITEEDRIAWQRERELEVAQEREREARSTATEARKRLLLANGFPLRSVEHAIADDGNSATIAFLRTWDRADRCVVALAGANGVGKTVAATWWAMRAPIAPLFVRATTFARSSRYRAGDPADGGDPGKCRWIDAPALVFDDVADEDMGRGGALLTDLDELVDTYYGGKKALIITTNLPAAAFAERYGARIADRLRECGAFFEDDSPSRRGSP